MSRHTEPLTEGFWTGPDPGTLQPGQLQDIRNAVYLPGVPSLQRAPGRDVFGIVSATAVNVAGLRDIQFENGDQYLIAMASNVYKSAPIGDTGSFTSLATLAGVPTTLESAQFRNRFYLMNGASAQVSAVIGSNLVAYLSATAAGSTLLTRQHGMIPVSTAPASASAASTFSQTVTGYYEYWTTEVARITQDGATLEIESTFTGTPATVFVSSTTYAPVITLPPIQNPGFTTHWRVYRSPKKTFSTDKEFPAGFMISDFTTATAQVTDSSTSTNTGYVFPATFNSGTDWSDFTNAANLSADDGNYASASAVSSSPPFFINKQYVAQGCYGFNFAGFKGQVVGVEVEIQAYTNSAPATVSVYIGPRDASTGRFRQDFSLANGVLPNVAGQAGGKNCLISSTNSASPTTVLLGGPTDRWFGAENAGLQDTDFDTNFMVLLMTSNSAARTIGFDYVRVKAYYGATIASTTVQFPAVTYTFGDVTAEVGKNGQPPSSSTGDFYEDQLVVNDVTNPSLVRFSYPGDPDAFPETYYIDLETSQNDVVRVIKTVNERLVVLCHNSSWRLNYLPSERDASFDRGKAKASISSTYGCTHSMGAAVFSPGGGQDLLAYVSHHGIHATDGYSFETFTDGLNWDAIMRPGSSTPIALINDRQRCLLLYYFQNTSDYGSETYLCLPLAYGEGHWKNGRPKVCGLIHVRNNSGATTAELYSAWAAQRQTGKVSVYMGYGGTSTTDGSGKVYVETGTTMPSLDPRLQYTTREIYLAGYGNEWRLGEIYGYSYGYAATTPSLSYVTKTRKTNDTALATRSTKNVTLGGQKLHKAGVANVMCEAAAITMAATASALALDFLVLDGQDFGVEESGR